MKTLVEKEGLKSGILSAERRNFLKKTGSVAIMGMFGVSFFTGCGQDDDPRPGTNGTPDNTNGASGISITNSEVNITLSQQSVLNNQGGWLLIIGAQMLVVNVGGNSFNALSSVCTHTGCDRNWSYSNGEFRCSCHGSRFTNTGTVVAGPATRDLRSFSTSVQDGVLKINRV
ncbi:MAG: Rieske (2Fe-2S) protein [Cyclobacteriaceae bacterium]|nr:Rieske (2Fe-2S) protein [Cyclobacteriaceae bacterium]